MFDKFNIKVIIEGQIDTLRDFKHEDKYIKGEVALIFFLPILISLTIEFIIPFELRDTGSNVLITSLSIFSALLLNLLLLIYDLVSKNEKTPEIDKIKQSAKVRLLGETFKNISFSILISVFAIIFLLISYLDIHIASFELNIVLRILTYYLVSMFLIVLLLILKRVHILLLNEVNDKANLSKPPKI